MRFPVLRRRALRLAGATLSLFALSAPAGAFTVSELPQSTAAGQPTVAVYQEGIDKPQVEQAYWRGGGWRGGGWGYHRGWGWGGGAFVGGLAAGALVGGALAAPYYGGYYGAPYGYYGGGPYYPGCWRSVWTYYGWRRVWAC